MSRYSISIERLLLNYRIEGSLLDTSSPPLQDDDARALVRSLVASGQLSFSNGGYTMFDEAGPTYVDMLDQTTLGIRFILSEFGPAGWN